MTESEWASGSNLWGMTKFLDIDEDMNERKSTLFNVACCDRVFHLMSDPRHGDAFLDARRLADGLMTADEFDARLRPVIELWRNLPPATTSVWEPSHYLTGLTRHLRCTSADAASYASRALATATATEASDEWLAAEADEERFQCHLLRDIFGNPFRPVTFSPSWLTPTAVGLAQAIYDDRAFDRLPILADALQDAGCEDEAILAHCRGDGPHVRGCWVVDGVLGKG